MDRIAAIDFETSFDSHRSISKMGEVEYVFHPETEIIGAAVAMSHREALWLRPDEIVPAIRELNPDALVSHNAPFDRLVWRHFLGPIDLPWHDTLAISRMFLPRGMNADLDAVAKLLFGIPKLEMPKDQSFDAMGEYAKRDAELCLRIFQVLHPELPPLADAVQLWATFSSSEPLIRLDVDLLREAVSEAEQAKSQSLEAARRHWPELTEETLRSTQKSTALILSRYPAQPPSYRKDDFEAQAFFAQTEELRVLFEARKQYASNIHVSRAERLIRIAESHPDRRCPMPLKAFSAGTRRFGGGAKINPQNLPRGSKIRHAMTAPDGYVFVVSDSSQIELRKNFWFCRELAWLDLIYSGEDPYRHSASRLCSKPVEQITKDERRIGKALELGCQYRMGWRNFKVWCAGGPLGMDPIILSDQEAMQAINAFRSGKPNVVSMWSRLDAAMATLVQGGEFLPSEATDQVVIRKERIDLPEGYWLDYTGIRPSEFGMVYGVGDRVFSIHGGKLLENIIQALANIAICRKLVDIHDRLQPLGGNVVLQVHDEIVALVPKQHVEAAKAIVEEEMVRPLDWAEGLVFGCETYVSEYYK